MVQNTRTIDDSRILGVTGYRGGVGERREVRNRTLASAAQGSSPKPMFSSILETFVHFLLMCPLGGI